MEFDGDWLKESLRVLGGNKRVFLGKNLFTKGACYAGYRYTDASFWGFFYNCDYKMQGEIRMQVQCGEENIEIRLVEAGKNWFASMPEYVLLYDGTPELSVTIGEIGQIHAQTRVFPLTDLPDRPEKHCVFESGHWLKMDARLYYTWRMTDLVNCLKAPEKSGSFQSHLSRRKNDPCTTENTEKIVETGRVDNGCIEVMYI